MESLLPFYTHVQCVHPLKWKDTTVVIVRFIKTESTAKGTERRGLIRLHSRRMEEHSYRNIPVSTTANYKSRAVIQTLDQDWTENKTGKRQGQDVHIDFQASGPVWKLSDDSSLNIQCVMLSKSRSNNWRKTGGRCLL